STRLYYLVRQWPFSTAHLIDADLSIDFAQVTTPEDRVAVIATAPQKRLAIKTFVRREEDGVLREAILRELKRGGQVYFLHNEVETIENKRARLAELVPEARIAVAHGQMHERELER
ncbi:class II glutamine amidotransferase, partial [Salmonella enterica subsp. enterica serovar Weltevreden]|nr:class II glutamine amidotransferase [Salmonella enterica subsp. enterica serovar Weltevreden]